MSLKRQPDGSWAGTLRSWPGVERALNGGAEGVLAEHGKTDTRMEQPAKTCPKCGSGDYTFRSRKKIEAAQGQAPAVETKYRCKACEHEWRVRVAVKGVM